MNIAYINCKQTRLSLFKFFILIFLPVMVGVCFLSTNVAAQTDNTPKDHIAPAPLFRDPVTDGAADPVLIWNREEKKWWMLYTQRRANTAGKKNTF